MQESKLEISKAVSLYKMAENLHGPLKYILLFTKLVDAADEGCDLIAKRLLKVTISEICDCKTIGFGASMHKFHFIIKTKTAGNGHLHES